MQSAKQNPEKLDTLSQHTVEANHSTGKLDMLSQHTEGKHAIPAYIAQINLYKRGCKTQNSGHADTATCCTLEEPEQKEQQTKLLQHFGRLGKRCEE